MMSFLGKHRWGYIVLPVVVAVSFILLLTMSLPASATTYTITPEADAFVQSSRANNNYGTWTRFRTQGAPEIRSYLRFDVQGLDGPVNTAVLRLSVRSTNGAGIAVHQVADNSWGETSITYNNAPPVGSIINSSGAVTQSSWIEIDVSSYVTQDGEISLALVGLDNNVIDFDARETAKAPELVINTDSTPPPTADFSANPQAGTAPHTVNFTNQSTNADSYLWQFGDGITSTVENPVHTYVQTGTFSVVLTANGLGGSNIFTHTDYITVTTPVISSTHLFTPTADAFVAAPLPNSNWGDGDYLQTKVAPGFNSYLRFDVQNISDTIKSATLRIFTEDHESIGFDLHVVTDTLWTEMGITWNNAPPIGSVITSSGTITGGTWAIIDVTQFVTTTGEYNFALTSANDNATHYSSREGSHPPELIIDTSDESSPVFVDFYAVPISGTVPLSVNFHNLSENGTEYVWRFGNGITSTLVAPVYTYTQTGVYTVTLTGTGPGGEDTEVKTNYITVYDTIPPTHTPTPTAMPTLTSTATSTNTPAPTQTLTPTTTSTNTPLPTTTNTPAPTETITPTATSTNTPLPTNTATMAPTITSTATSTAVPTITPIPTQEPPIDDTIGISPTVKTVAVGDLFTVTVEMYNLETAVSGYQFDLSYDDTLLQLETVTDGTFFEGFGQDTVCPEWVEPTSSSLRLACVGVGPNAGATGNGRLATLTFLALDNGLTDLTLSAIQLADTAVPAAPVTIDVQQGIIVITESSAAATALVDDASGNGTGGIFSAAWWSTTWQNVDETAVIFTIALSILLVALLYLDRQRQLRYLWRIIVSLSLILQVIVYVPTPIRAAGADSAAGIDGKRPLRSTETLMPPVLPEATTSLGCYDADLDCDKDVDEADVTTASPHWDCDNSAACYDVDADIDDNNIIDVFDLAWVTNDYDILPPEITIDSPTEGAVVTGANLTVSGQLSDQHQISEVTVNGTTAQLTGNAFSVQLPVESGNFVLDVIAEDEIGQFEIASRVVMADQSGPLIKIEVPANRQAVYILNPTVEVVYGDFLSAVDSSSFMAELKDSTNTVVQSFNSTVAGSESAQFSLATLSTDQTYTLTATIADAHGNSSMTSSSFFVTPDTAIVPPTVPQNPGWISGRVYDSASCNEHLTTCDGLAGVQVTIMQVDPDALTTVRDDRADFYESEGALNGAFPAGSADVVDEYATAVNGTILTGPDGFYAFPVDTTGVYHLRFEKDNYTYGQREVTAVRERSTAVNELYLTEIDNALTLCGSTGCFHTSADGQMTVDIPEDAIPVGTQVEVTATEFDRVFFLPSGQLPPGTGETYAFNLGGNSDYEFQKPITVSLKNSRGFDPGMVIPLGYWNQHTLQWEHESVAIVDDTGEWVVMQTTHFSNHDPNFPILASDFDVSATDKTENDDSCADGESGCFINLQSGSLREWIDLPMVNVAGDSAGPQLAYNTDRANPSAIIDVQFDINLVGSVIAEHMTWELYIEGEKTDTLTFASNLSQVGEVGRYRYMWDGRNALGELLPPGVYPYAVKIGLTYGAEYCRGPNSRFGADACVEGTEFYVPASQDMWVYGEVTLNTQQENGLGAGWVIEGQQSIYEDEAGRVLIAEDDALTQYYFDFKDLLSGAAAYSAAQPTVVGPASVDFPVTEISGGTDVSGIININTTWTMAQSPYVIKDDDVTVASGATLTIEPGVQVLLDDGRNVIVEGVLDAQATATNPITFTAHYDPNNQTAVANEGFETYLFYYDDTYPLTAKATTVDADNALWIAGDGYDNVLNNDLLALVRQDADLTTRQQIPFPVGTESSGVRDLAVDGSGRKWVATDQGVFMLAADNSTWTQYTAVTSNLNTDDVKAVSIAPDGTIWFGLNGSGTQQLSTDLTTWTTYNVANNQLTSDVVNDIGFDGLGNVWFGTGNSLIRYDEGNNSWTTFTNPNNSTASFSQLDIDQNNNVWAISWGVPLQLSSNDSSWTTHEDPDFRFINTLVVDTADRKWIGAIQSEVSGAGVQVLLADNTTWDDKSELNISNETVNDMVVSPVNGDVWVAAGNGSVIRNFLSGSSMFDNTIIGGYWGNLQITGDADLSHVTLEMGGKGYQSTLQFVDTPNAISASNLTVRASGGNGIEIENSDITLDDVTILSNRGNGLHVGTSATVTVTNGLLQQNKQNGLYLDQNSELVGTDVTIVNNLVAIYATHKSASIDLTTVTVTNNDGVSRLPVQTMIDGLIWQDNQQNDIEWLGGTISADTIWMSAPEIGRHIIFEHILVDATATLTIPMGTTFTFSSSAELIVNGDLVANGTFDDPIYLGAFTDHWDGVTLAGDTAVFQYTTIQDATTGLTINGTDTTMAYMTIAGNDTGISANNNATVTIANSNIAGNSVTAVTNSSGAAFTVDARHNYWGHPDGPTHASNPNGGGDVVGDDVDFLSWRGPVLMDNLTTYAANETATDYSNLQYDAGVYTRLYANGRSVQFDAQGRHDFTLFPDGRQHAYTYNPDGSTATFEVIAPGQTAPNAIWTFNYTDGKLDNITDPVGRVMDFEVDGNNQLTQVSIPEMGDHRFYYNEQNLMTQQMDAAGAVTEYGYNGYGRIASHTDPLREVTDANTGALSMSSELRQFVGSDTGYTLINDLAASDPDNPAPAAPTTGALNNSVAYGIGSRTTKTNEWGHILEQTDSLNRTTQMQRDEANNVTRMDFPNGDCVEANYDEQGNILSVNRLPATQCTLLPQDRDPLQQQTSARSYEAQFNQPKTLVDPGGDSITYIYDYELGLGDAGLLMRIEYPSVPDENGVLTTPTVNYTYNDLGLLATETDVRGTVTRYIYTQGTADEAAGGANPLFAPGVTPVPGLVTQVIADDGGFNQTTISKDFDELGNPQTIIFPGNVQTLATHDELGRLDSATSIEGIVTIYEYNDRGQLVRQVVDYTADGVTGDNVVTTYEYDSNGRLLHQRTAADGLVVETYSKYDLNGRLVSETDSQGNETRYVYDDADQLIQTIDPTQQSTFYTYTNQGMPETVTDAEGHVTRTVYDEYGRPKQIIRAEGELNLTTTYTYTIDSLVTAMEDTDGTVTCYEYDSLRRITKNIQDCGSGHLNLTISYAYDLAGNTVYITNTRGIVTYNEYDALGRLTLTRQDDGGLNYEARTTYNVAGNVDTNIAVDGTVTQYHYDTYNRLQQICEDSPGMNLCTSYGYDLHGRQDSVTDAEGIIQQTNFNRLGLPIQEIADVNGLAATISFEYDDLLNLVQIADPNGNLTRYTYTARQEVETELYADGTTKSFTYTPRGSVDTETLQDGAVIDHSYDAANRQTRLDFSTGGFQQFIYDDAGRLTNVSQTMDGHTTVTGYGYNRIGEVVTTTQQLDGGTAWLTQYAYDYALGEHTITYPSGTERVYKTDHINRLDAVEMGDSTIVADYAYDVFNRFNTVSYPTNNLANRQAYDPLGRINNVTVNDGLTDLVDYGYGYDNVGNRIYMQRNHELNQPADVYEYDNLYQLNHVWYGADATTSSTISSYDSTQTYDLDTLGNRLSVTADTVLTQYGPNNGTKLTNAMNRYESIESDTLGYDLRGNTLTDGNNTYSYDILNRQTSVDNGNVTTEYIYDARGRRIAKVAAGITTHFIYDTQYRVIEERDNSEALIATYTYGKGMDELLLMERGGNDYYYHRDALGSITEVSDATGTIVEQYEYDVYGEVTIYDGSDNVLTATAIDNPYLFTGRRYDAESGNYYYRARHYNPEMGRFLSEDPLGFGSGDYNLYRYVFNNPLNLLDPTGKSVKDFLVDHRDAIAVGAAAIAATAFVIATGGVGAVVILGAIAVGAGTAALTTASINVIDETCDNLWDGVARNSIYGAVAGAGAAFMGPAVLWGEGVAASATALTGLSSVGSGVGTAVTAGVIGGASAFAGGVACAIGSGADYYDCANVAAAGSALHGGSYLAGEGINFLSHVQNMREFRPKNIRFTQSTVTNESSDGVYTVEGNIERLSKEPDWHVPGKNSPTNPIRIFRKTPEMDWGEVTHPKYGFTGNTSNLENGKWYSIDNRRLYTYQQAKGRNYIPYEIIDDLKLIRRHGWKFTTGNFGKEAELIYNN